LGCDDPAPQGAIQTQQPPAAAAAAAESARDVPTTQELVGGPRKTMALGPIPLTLRVPESWKIEVTSGASLLTGHTPSSQGDKDKISIQLTSRSSMTQEQVDRMLDGAKKEQQAKPQAILKVEVRPLGNVRVYERQSVGEPRPYTTFDARNQPHTTTEQMFNWTISVLAPFEGAFQVYELNFVGLTKSLYDKDAEFMRGILNTLQYGAPAPSAPAGTLPATAPALP
jgi:hypothetical protein